MVTPDTKQESRKPLARILSTVGAIWIVLFAVANVVNAGGTPIGDLLAFFGNNLFFPLALIFAGRAIGRQAGRRAGSGGIPQSGSQRTPPDLNQGRPPAQPRRPAPTPEQSRKPEVTSSRPPAPRRSPDIDELAKAMGFDDLEETAEAPDRASSYTPKSSEEMIAEAREKLSRDPKTRDYTDDSGAP